ncbi:hypothetical protein KY284_020007 [Solanum tuberosum]|nr:hypothetical protein KY284_020007 [Solanum tuberosum]
MLCYMEEISLRGRPSFQHKIVRWSPPSVGWLKCNTDGASRGNPGPSAAAFCIRDHNDNFLGEKGVKIPDFTNLVAEAITMREGLQYYLENQLSHIIMEPDSLAMVNIINGVWETPWNVTMEVLLSLRFFKTSHQKVGRLSIQTRVTLHT